MGKPNTEPAPPYMAVPVDAPPSEKKKEDPARGKWGHSMDFILSAVGFAVGLGNVWRFPYLCYRNGGGAFMLPYCIMLVIAGIPLFVLELAVGQFTSRGCISIWAVSPIFRGLGYAMIVIVTLVCCYYNVVISYIIYYLFASFTRVLPWSTCDNQWNTPNCTVSVKGQTIDMNISSYLGNETGYNETYLPPIYQTRPSQEFWDNKVLERSEGIHEPGTIRWQLLLCLLFSWLVVYLCIMKGVKSSGKVVYFTATFPYIVIFILLIRGVTLPGAADGILFFIKPDFQKLKDANVWKDAAVQIFFSLGPAFGCIPTLASYNEYKNNFYRDGIIISLINCGTSVFAGFAIFSVIGFMSYSSGLPIDKVIDSGPGLAFVAYPEALARMPLAPFWSVLFFLMLYTLGLDSMFVNVECIITGICDEVAERTYPAIHKKKWLVSLVVCIFLFLINFAMITQGGIYVVTLFDNYAASLAVLVVAFLECIVFSYIYGIDNFCKDLSHMLGFKLGMYWKICWMFITPMVLLFIFIFYCVGYEPLTYDGYEYPAWAEGCGWMMVMASCLMIPGYAIYYLVRHTAGTMKERLYDAMRPAPEWGPANNSDRAAAGYPLLQKETLRDPEPNTPPPEYKAIYTIDDDNQSGSVEMETVEGAAAV